MEPAPVQVFSLEEYHKQIKQLSQLIEVNKSIAAQLDLEPLLQQIVDSASQLLSADLGGLLVMNQEKTTIEYFKVSGWASTDYNPPNNSEILHLPFHERRPIRVDDVRVHPRSSGFPKNHPEVGPFLAVPLMSKDISLGVLFVGNFPEKAAFDSNAENLLNAFAAQATIAIENARLYARSDELGRLCERQRIAKELHDSVVQMLFTIGLETEWCLTQFPADNDNEEMKNRLQVIRHLVARSSDELRSSIYALNSPCLTADKGLEELLQAQLNEFEARSGIPAKMFIKSGMPELPPLVTDAVYRIIVESLSNVRKHAHATGVFISLDFDNDSVSVTIQDNGIGLSAPIPDLLSNNPFHFGVSMMRQATAQAEGAFFIDNNDDQGTIIKARFPLPRGKYT